MEARTEQVSTQPFDWQMFLAHLARVMVALIVIGIGLGLYFGWRPLRTEAKRIVTAKDVSVRIDWPALPSRGNKSSTGAPAAAGVTPVANNPSAKPPRTWLSEQFQEELLAEAFAALGPNPDPFQREPLDRVAASMERTGWFVGRPTVEREAESGVRVRGTWRVPAAVVRFGEDKTGKDYLVSWDGYPMPVVYDAGDSKMVYIKGAATQLPQELPPEVLVAPWPGEDVGAALELLSTLRPQAWIRQVVAIDVSEYAKTRRLSIITTSGGRVVWGGRPSKPLLGEISTKAKLARVAEVNQLFGQIDAKVKLIEVFWDRPLVFDISAESGASKAAPKPEETSAKPRR
jgi:hypothetical protein